MYSCEAIDALNRRSQVWFNAARASDRFDLPSNAEQCAVMRSDIAAAAVIAWDLAVSESESFARARERDRTPSRVTWMTNAALIIAPIVRANSI